MVRPSRLNLLCSGLATTRTLCHCSQTSKATTCCDRWKRIRVQPSSSRSLASSSGPSVATKQHKVLKYKTAASHASLLKIHYYSELFLIKKSQTRLQHSMLSAESLSQESPRKAQQQQKTPQARVAKAKAQVSKTKAQVSKTKAKALGVKTSPGTLLAATVAFSIGWS